MKGIAEYYNNGEYYDLCKTVFYEAGVTEPKGVIVVKVNEIQEIK